MAANTFEVRENETSRVIDSRRSWADREGYESHSCRKAAETDAASSR
jgi:hypothetical protein